MPLVGVPWRLAVMSRGTIKALIVPVKSTSRAARGLMVPIPMLPFGKTTLLIVYPLPRFTCIQVFDVVFASSLARKERLVLPATASHHFWSAPAPVAFQAIDGNVFEAIMAEADPPPEPAAMIFPPILTVPPESITSL